MICRIPRAPKDREFVLSPSKIDAEDFMGEHKSKRRPAVDEATPDIVARLDAGKF